MGHDSACPSIGLDGAALSTPNRIIDDQQTQRDGEQVEETIVPRRRDCDLEKNEKPTRKQPQSARRPNEKRNDDFDDEEECDRKFLEPLRTLIGPPTDHSRQWLRPVMIIKRGQVPPGIVAAGELYHAGHDHEFEEQELEQKNRGARNGRIRSALWPKSPWRDEDRQETSFN